MKVLFLCDGNADRSRMAEGLLRHIGSENLAIWSIGVRDGDLDPTTFDVMQEIGIDISAQESTPASQTIYLNIDLLVTLSNSVKGFYDSSLGSFSHTLNLANSGLSDRLYIGAPATIHWHIADPAEGEGGAEDTLAAFRDARNDLRDRIEKIIEDGTLSALAHQRALMDNLADLLEDGLVAHDDLRRVFLFNKAAEKITGLTREQVLGKDCHELFPPDGLCGSHCRFSSGPSKLAQKIQYKVPMTNAEGEDKILKVSASPFRLDGKIPRGVLALFHDATEFDDMRTQLKSIENFHGMISESANMREIFGVIRSVATSDYPVLITGESGTGKELTARAVHMESRRKAGPFVPVNCGALPENILESELFGHVRGAFTGAIKDKKGRFELAHKGTLFLDEVGELSPSFQVKLLRVLQEKRFEKVGGEKSVTVDVRVISATNRDLQQLVQEGKFREDLYYRLCVVPIVLPPLRDRLNDMPMLVNHILKKISKESGRPVLKIPNETLKVMMSYRWPGNIRQLINTLQFASIRCVEETLGPDYLPPEITGSGFNMLEKQETVQSNVNQEPVTGGRRRKLEVLAVKQALSETGGNKLRAAKLLNVGRATLYRFLKDHSLE